VANLLDLLNERIVLGDGATGTYFYELGVPLNHCLEEVNLSRPELLTRVYREYADAGAQVIETNSFGANRIRLARFGLDHQVGEINWRAAQVARDAVKGRRDVSSADRSGRFRCATPTANFRPMTARPFSASRSARCSMAAAT